MTPAIQLLRSSRRTNPQPTTNHMSTPNPDHKKYHSSSHRVVGRAVLSNTDRRRVRRRARQGRPDRFGGHEPRRRQPRSDLARRNGGHPSRVVTLQSFKLPGCALYTSAEPCPMCMAAVTGPASSRCSMLPGRGCLQIGDFDDRPIYEQLALPKEQRSIWLRPNSSRRSRRRVEGIPE